MTLCSTNQAPKPLNLTISSGLLPALTANPGTIRAVSSWFSYFWRTILGFMPRLYFFAASCCWWSWPCTIPTQDLDCFLTVALSVFSHWAAVDICLCFCFFFSNNETTLNNRKSLIFDLSLPATSRYQSIEVKIFCEDKSKVKCMWW